jgi:uncharacterized protein (TIGR03032 family)
MSRPIVVIAPPRSGGGMLAAALATQWGMPVSVPPREEMDEGTETLGDGAHFSPRLGLQLSHIAETQPQARFLMMLRDPGPTVASAMVAWSSGRFVSEPDLPGWWGDAWSFGLTPGWQELIGAPLAQVCAGQWSGYVTAILDGLAGIDPDRWMVTSYERMLADTDSELDRVGEWLGDERTSPSTELALSAGTITKPTAQGWHRQAGEIVPALEKNAEIMARFTEFRDAHAPAPQNSPESLVEDIAPEATRTTVPSSGTVFSSSHTASFPELLAQTLSSVLVTTYKSGHAILLRADADRKLNTEFASYRRPMGIAQAGSRLALGTDTTVINYSNTPSLAQHLQPADVNDAVFTTRSTINTGDIAIHEMAFAGEELWVVNTRFSCLCTLDVNYSFEPRWRPEWISELAGEDRCHLNGLAMRDGRPRYVTALAQTDTAHGWREKKGVAGLIVDIDDNTIITSGLAMPHSPRWHDGTIWFLESGKGALSRVDMASGEVTTVATLPGFTRGLAFIGPYALVGLSQVRESVFSELPVTETTAERNCGVWIVDTRTGETAGFVKFEGVVQEIFDLQVLPGMKWPTFIQEPSTLTTSAFVLSDTALKQVARP